MTFSARGFLDHKINVSLSFRLCKGQGGAWIVTSRGRHSLFFSGLTVWHVELP